MVVTGFFVLCKVDKQCIEFCGTTMCNACPVVYVFVVVSELSEGTYTLKQMAVVTEMTIVYVFCLSRGILFASC